MTVVPTLLCNEKLEEILRFLADFQGFLRAKNIKQVVNDIKLDGSHLTLDLVCTTCTG